MTKREAYRLMKPRLREERPGQAMFNALWMEFPAEVERLRGTALDPFYDDSRIENFLNALGIHD